MLDALANILWLIMGPCYEITQNWWVSILLFTVIVKVILMPLALWVQKNSIAMVQLMPALNEIKVRYFGDSETIGEKQHALYKERHYHPLLSLVPLAIQILILFGLVEVIHGVTDGGAPGTEFLGMVPIENGGVSWIMPVLAGLSAVIMGFAQNRINPLQKEQSRAEKNMTNGLSIALSLFLGVFVAAGMAFYWICSNLTAVLVQVVCNICIKPSKHIDYEKLELSRVPLEELNSLTESKSKWWKPSPLAKREKNDYKRFFNAVGKHIVFYSEASGFYKYFQGAIEYVLSNSDAYIHYITLDPNDKVFELSKTEPRIIPYYISEKRAITLFMKMDADIVVLTTEDLESYYLKRSYVRKDIEYVFFFHHMTSTHLTPQKHSYEHYDTLMCVGPHQKNEIRAAEKLYGFAEKNLVECGYDLLDREIEDHQKGSAASESAAADNVPTVLIAPSWQESNILDSCIDPALNALLERGWRIVVRPHPEYVKRYKVRWDALRARYDHVPESKLYFEQDFSSNSTVFESDVLITDWSSVFCEFCFSTGKPAIFVDTPMKVNNPNWEELGIEPTDISWRNQVGVSVALEDVEDRIADIADEMLSNPDRWRDQIINVRNETIYNQGRAGEIAGEYLIERMIENQKKRAHEKEISHA